MNKKIVKSFQELLGRFSFMDKYRDVKMRSPQDIKKIPFVKRLELQNWELDKAPEKPAVFYEATGGEDGNNFFIGINKGSHNSMVERTVQAMGLMKVKKGENCLNLLFSDLVERGIIKYGGVLMSVGDVHSSKTFKLAQDALETLNIKYVFACPNLLWDVLLLLGKNHSIEKCMVSGELLLPWFRKTFYKNTGILLYDWYGSSGGFLAAQDDAKEGDMRVLDKGIYLEVVDSRGNSSETGEGTLVYTDLFNYSTPIIRYVLEDEVKLVKRGKHRYVKIYRRKGEHLKLDGELTYKNFVVNQVEEILGHKHFFIVVTKTEDYKDRINIFLLKSDLKKKKEINYFFHRYIGLSPTIATTDKIAINKRIIKGGHIFDSRRVK